MYGSDGLWFVVDSNQSTWLIKNSDHNHRSAYQGLPLTATMTDTTMTYTYQLNTETNGVITRNTIQSKYWVVADLYYEGNLSKEDMYEVLKFNGNVDEFVSIYREF
jgi:hypothetical protein